MKLPPTGEGQQEETAAKLRRGSMMKLPPTRDGEQDEIAFTYWEGGAG